jgi:iron complex transport system substrate-binding protein
MFRKLLFILLILVFMLSACAPQAAPVIEPTNLPAPTEIPPTPEPTNTFTPLSTNLTAGCVEVYDPNIDYFPEKMTVEIASGMRIEYHNNYKVVSIPMPWQDANESFRYILVQCGTPAPEGYADATFVEVPIHSIVAMSTTYLAQLDSLDLLDSLVAIDTSMYTSNPKIIEAVKAGKVAEVGSGQQLNIEAVLNLDPDVVMTYGGSGPDYDSHPKLIEAGQTVVLNADFMENHPLGRAEWVKFVAAFYNQEARATQIFNGVRERYTALANLAAASNTRPRVFANTPYSGTWYMPGGASYIARLLSDAGSQYVWADDTTTGTLYLSTEVVYEKAANADYWINISYTPTLEALKSADPRFADFSAFQNSRVYANDLRSTANGGNDFFESGAANPDVILADLIKIFHPDLLIDHALIYYFQVK